MRNTPLEIDVIFLSVHKTELPITPTPTKEISSIFIGISITGSSSMFDVSKK